MVINGSPKSEKSNTFKITKAFLEGIEEKEKHEVEILDLKKLEIDYCNGCFACWRGNSGKCVIKDDMEDCLKKFINADVVIWSFPLYYFGMPSKTKAFLDKLLPLNLPTINIEDNSSNSHVDRYDLTNQKNVLISTCGFCSVKDNYEAVLMQFDILNKNGYAKIICPEGELFKVKKAEPVTSKYLKIVKTAGKEIWLILKFLWKLKCHYPNYLYLLRCLLKWQIKAGINLGCIGEQ